MKRFFVPVLLAVALTGMAAAQDAAPPAPPAPESPSAALMAPLPPAVPAHGALPALPAPPAPESTEPVGAVPAQGRQFLEARLQGDLRARRGCGRMPPLHPYGPR